MKDTQTHTHIRVGDLVWWRHGFGKQPAELARVERIELVEPNQSDGGESVMEVEWVRDRSFVVDLDNGHWAYAFQICPTS